MFRWNTFTRRIALSIDTDIAAQEALLRRTSVPIFSYAPALIGSLAMARNLLPAKSRMSPARDCIGSRCGTNREDGSESAGS